jgi:hypothetical protein
MSSDRQVMSQTDQWHIRRLLVMSCYDSPYSYDNEIPFILLSLALGSGWSVDQSWEYYS